MTFPQLFQLAASFRNSISSDELVSLGENEANLFNIRRISTEFLDEVVTMFRGSHPEIAEDLVDLRQLIQVPNGYSGRSLNRIRPDEGEHEVVAPADTTATPAAAATTPAAAAPPAPSSPKRKRKKREAAAAAAAPSTAAAAASSPAKRSRIELLAAVESGDAAAIAELEAILAEAKNSRNGQSGEPQSRQPQPLAPLPTVDTPRAGLSLPLPLPIRDRAPLDRAPLDRVVSGGSTMTCKELPPRNPFDPPAPEVLEMVGQSIQAAAERYPPPPPSPPEPEAPKAPKPGDDDYLTSDDEGIDKYMVVRQGGGVGTMV